MQELILSLTTIRPLVHIVDSQAVMGNVEVVINVVHPDAMANAQDIRRIDNPTAVTKEAAISVVSLTVVSVGDIITMGNADKVGVVASAVVVTLITTMHTIIIATTIDHITITIWL